MRTKTAHLFVCAFEVFSEKEEILFEIEHKNNNII